MADEEVAFRSQIRASGLGEVWTHITDAEKFKQYGWRTTTKEDCYSPNTLVGNWCEDRFDIERTRVPKRLPSQVSLNFITFYFLIEKRTVYCLSSRWTTCSMKRTWARVAQRTKVQYRNHRLRVRARCFQRVVLLGKALYHNYSVIRKSR